MHINWFPGHMHKAGKEMRKVLPQMDLLIEILDARLPFSSENPMLAEIRGDKSCIKILHKSDLADPVLTQEWQDFLDQQRGVKTLALCMEDYEKIQQIPDLCHKVAQIDVAREKPLMAMIVGIPNVGKSTLINALVGRSIAKTGNEPAVTQRQQRIQLRENLVLLDTPGVLWPKIAHQNSAYRLAVTGAIKETAMEVEDVAFFAAEYLIQHYPDNLLQRYELEKLATDVASPEMTFFEQMGRLRGCLRSGGAIDLHKAGKLLLTELRAGTLGRITLENPQQTEREKVEARKAMELAEAKKLARKKRKGAAKP